jgi:hypothetical protein
LNELINPMSLTCFVKQKETSIIFRQQYSVEWWIFIKILEKFADVPKIETERLILKKITSENTGT